MWRNCLILLRVVDEGNSKLGAPGWAPILSFILTKEFHTLFDQGYVTVTPDYEVRVSSALGDTWKNGKRYYSFDGKALCQKPKSPSLYPSQDALAWYGEHCFLG